MCHARACVATSGMQRMISPDVRESGKESMSVGASMPRCVRLSVRIAERVTVATDSSKRRPRTAFLYAAMVAAESTA